MALIEGSRSEGIPNWLIRDKGTQVNLRITASSSEYIEPTVEYIPQADIVLAHISRQSGKEVSLQVVQYLCLFRNENDPNL
jgi:hypothetical protein